MGEKKKPVADIGSLTNGQLLQAYAIAYGLRGAGQEPETVADAEARCFAIAEEFNRRCMVVGTVEFDSPEDIIAPATREGGE